MIQIAAMEICRQPSVRHALELSGPFVIKAVAIDARSAALPFRKKLPARPRICISFNVDARAAFNKRAVPWSASVRETEIRVRGRGGLRSAAHILGDACSDGDLGR